MNKKNKSKINSKQQEFKNYNLFRKSINRIIKSLTLNYNEFLSFLRLIQTLRLNFIIRKKDKKQNILNSDHEISSQNQIRI